MICSFLKSSDDRMNPCIVPVSAFRTSTTVEYCSAYSNALVSKAKYIDDTHISIACYNQTANYGSMFVAGIK